MAQSIFMKKLRDSMGIIFFIVAILFGASIAFRGLVSESGRKEPEQENTIAIVAGKDKIEYAEFAKEFDSEVQMAHDRGQDVDDFAAEDFREQAWHTIVNRRILKPQFKEKLVDGYTGTEIYERLKRNPPEWLRNHPQFQTDGKFDYQKFLDALNNQQIDWSPVERALAANLPYDKMKTLISTMTFVTMPEAMDEFVYRNTKFRGEFIVFGPECGTVSVDTSEQALKRYYDEHKDSLVERAYVKFSYVEIPYQASARDSAEVRSDVDTVLVRLAEGDDFEMLASAYSQDMQSAQNGGELGWFGRGKLVKEFETAAFQLDSGEVSKPVLTQFGWHIIRCTGKKIVSDTTTGVTDTLLHLQHILFRIEPGFETSDSIEAFADDVHQLALTAGLEAAAEKYGLEIYHTPPVGKDEQIPGIGMRTMVNRFAFTHKPGDVPDIVASNNKFFILSVDEVVPDSFASFDDARWFLKKKIIEDAQREKCRQMAGQALMKLRSGEPMKKVAMQFGAKYDTTGLTGIFETMANGEYDPWVAGAMLGIDAVDSISNIIDAQNGKFYIVKLWELQHPDMAKFSDEKEQIRQQIFQAKRDNAYNFWFTKLRKLTPIEDLRAKFFGEETPTEEQDTM